MRIFDADNSCDDSLRRIQKSMQEKLDNEAQNVEIFLFPNNKDTGNLETLLLDKIATKPKLIECFDCYKNCIESKENGASDNIEKKSKWYAYKEASGLLKAEKKQKSSSSYQINYQKYFNFESKVLKDLRKTFFLMCNKKLIKIKG